MSKKRIAIISILVLLLGGAGYVGYKLYFTKTESVEALSLIPEDAVFVIETDEPVKAWKTFSKSPIWQHIKNYKPLGDIGKTTDEITKNIEDNSIIFSAFGRRNVLISAHVVSATDYDFLYVCDMQKSAKFDVVQSGMIKLLKNQGFEHIVETVSEDKLEVFFDPKLKSYLYMSFVGNQLAISYNKNIISKALTGRKQAMFARSADVQSTITQTAGGLCKFYLNYKTLPKYLDVYMDDVSSMKQVCSGLNITGSAINMDDRFVSLSGTTFINDSMEGQIKALAQSGKGKMNCQSVFSKDAAFVMSLGFQSFSKFFENFKAVLKQEPSKFQEYEKNKRMAERLLGFSIEDDFLGWIDDEVAVAHYKQSRVVGGKIHNVVAIKAQSIDKAKEKLGKVEKKIRNRTLGLKFKSANYKENYEVHYLEAKGLFGLLFGKLFSKVEKPYYTYLGDYVVFSDDVYTLLKTIDDWEAKTTLSKEEEFKDIESKMQSENSVFAYLNMKKYFLDMKGILDASSYKSSFENREFIMCFEQFAFQWTEKEGDFETKIEIDFQKPQDEDLTVEEDSAISAEAFASQDSMGAAELFVMEHISKNVKKELFDNGNTMYIAEMSEGQLHGKYQEFWENGKIKITGKYRNGQKIGKWRYYNEEGKLERKEKLSGEAKKEDGLE